LRAQVAQFLKTPEGQNWMETSEGEKWLKTTKGKAWTYQQLIAGAPDMNLDLSELPDAHHVVQALAIIAAQYPGCPRLRANMCH